MIGFPISSTARGATIVKILAAKLLAPKTEVAKSAGKYSTFA